MPCGGCAKRREAIKEAWRRFKGTVHPAHEKLDEAKKTSPTWAALAERFKHVSRPEAKQ